MEEGTIVRWLRRDGDEVARGEELVEIETDKATLAYESDTAGTLQITAQEGATLPVGARIALIGGDDSVPSVAPAAVPPAKTASGDETSGRGTVTTTEPTRTQTLIARRMAESRATGRMEASLRDDLQRLESDEFIARWSAVESDEDY